MVNFVRQVVFFFFQYAFRCEQEAYGGKFETPHRATTGADLQRAATMILKGEAKSGIVNVVGDWTWPDDQLPDVSHMALATELFQTNQLA